MTPESLAKPNTEHAHQTAFFCWISQQSIDPRLKFAFAIPNGGERDVRVATRLKAEGVRQGVADTFIPIPVGTYHGIWIEFKKPGRENHKEGGLSDEQVKWRDYLISQNYAYFVAYSYRQAVDATVIYLRSN